MIQDQLYLKTRIESLAGSKELKAIEDIIDTIADTKTATRLKFEITSNVRPVTWENTGKIVKTAATTGGAIGSILGGVIGNAVKGAAKGSSAGAIGAAIGAVSGALLGGFLGWFARKQMKTQEVTHIGLKETVTEYHVNEVEYKIDIDCRKHKESLKKLTKYKVCDDIEKRLKTQNAKEIKTKFEVSFDIEKKLKAQKAELEEFKKVENELDKQITKLNSIQMSFDNTREHQWRTMVSQVEAFKNDINQIVNNVRE
ncbi:hypothetical protein RFI_39021 [Reticulomyxa filosa]|uniref:Glycine zipper domain-containing protein n=1 Tax=Reticulomyxa filosa TaxID=46433 RepID=X6LBH2_RETFI|nr:hypothetical protein RFI_39021 [Reticulomyxa filosa]|eukprot:ETN98476.1 hypothetical protein RFI_39021 [Reticulomyxa filosa]